jgi:hypothetical protein
MTGQAQHAALVCHLDQMPGVPVHNIAPLDEGNETIDSRQCPKSRPSVPLTGVRPEYDDRMGSSRL